MEPTHWKEMRALRCTVGFFFCPITPVYKRKWWCHPLHTLGQWWLEESNRSRRAVGVGRRKGGVVKGAEEALCFIYHGYYVLAPLLEHNNTRRFKFLPSLYSLFPSFNSVPASPHTSYGLGSKTWISHLLRLLCNYLEGRRWGWGGCKTGKWRLVGGGTY